jgi:serine/threonine-protein kinase HipA
MPVLHVWMNGEPVGLWSASRRGVPTFQYLASWLASPAVRALSLSLPLTSSTVAHRGAVVANYFDNLLPESAPVRQRLAMRFKTRSTDAFDLLTAIGRDCVGAVQLLPEDATPQGWNTVASQPLSHQAVERLLLGVTSDDALGMRADDAPAHDLRFSVAGMQRKTALLRIGGAWHVPLGATPTTHLLKPPIGAVGARRADLSTSVANEWLCAQILQAWGLPVARVEMAVFGTQKALVVERFDRRWMGVGTVDPNARRFAPPPKAWIARLPQEDFCQATGTAPAKKYESDGGPGVHACLQVLASSERREQDLSHFVLAQFAFWLLAATDGHAKNFSIFHQRGGGHAMTPLYDVLSAWPILGHQARQFPERDARMAMALHGKNKHRHLQAIQARHWQALVAQSGVNDVDALWISMQAMAQTVGDTMQRVQRALPKDFPAQVWDAVHAGVVKHAARFLREVDAT